MFDPYIINEPMHEITNNVVCATSIRAVWSEPLLIAWVYYDCLATDWTPFGVSKLNRRLQRLVRVYTCQNVKLLEISCRGSEPVHDISNNVVCATSKVSDKPAHMRSLTRAFASRLSVNDC